MVDKIIPITEPGLILEKFDRVLFFISMHAYIMKVLFEIWL